MDRTVMLTTLNLEDENRVTKIKKQVASDIKNKVDPSLIKKQQARIHIIQGRISDRLKDIKKESTK